MRFILSIRSCLRADRPESSVSLEPAAHLVMAFDLIGRKDNEKSRKIRITGDRHFRNFEYVEAVESYNASLSYAHGDSSNTVPTAYSDRASVFLKVGLFDEALKSVDLALATATKADDLRYLREKRERYVVLQEQKRALLSVVRKAKAQKTLTPELSHPSLPNVPYASERIKICEDEQFGRFLVAKKDLNPGDIIILEPPVCNVLDKTFIYKKCSRCFKACNFNLLPCPMCSLAMFCSPECLQEATELYHNYECPIMGSIINVLCDEGRIPWISLRLLLMALNAFEDLDELIALFKASRTDKFRFDTFDFRRASPADMIQYVLHLARKTKDEKEHAEMLEMATFIMDALYRKTDLRYRAENEYHRKALLDLLMRFFYINLANNFALSSFPTWQEKSEMQHTEQFGTALYPFTSLINHACASNLKVKAIGETNTVMMVYVCRPIRPGEQLFITYNKHLSHLHAEKFTRNSQILRELGFHCGCQACRDGFPTVDDLEVRNVGTEEETALVQNGFADLSVSEKIQEAQLRLPKCIDMIVKYEHRYPCLETHQFEALLEYCMSTMYNSKPFLYE